MASDATKQTINQSLIDLKAEVADRTKSVITGVKIPELEDTRIISNTDQLIIETGDGTKRTTMRAFGDFVGTGLATPKEVQDARGNYPQLGDRLDAMDGKIGTNEQNIQNNAQEIQGNKQEITNLKNKQDTLSKEVEEAREDNKTPNTIHNSLKERLDSDYEELSDEIEKTNTQLSIFSKYNGLKNTLHKLQSQSKLVGCALGDSLTWGAVANSSPLTQVTTPYPMALESTLKTLYAYNDITIHNVGKPGFTSQELSDVIDGDVLVKNPDFCIVMVGTNDVLQVKGTDYFYIGLENIIKKLLKAGIEVCLMTMPDIYDFRFKDSLNQYLKIIRELSIVYNVDLCELNTMLNDLIVNEVYYPIDLMPDNVHLSEIGYEYISDVLASTTFFKDTLFVEKNKSLPAFGNRFVKSNISTINVDDTIRFKRYFEFPISAQQTGKVITMLIYCNDKNTSMSVIGKADISGASRVNYRINQMASSFSCYSNTKETFSQLLIYELKIGLNILSIVDSGEDGKIAYISGFEFGSHDEWKRLGLLNNWRENLGEYEQFECRNESGVTYLRGVINGGLKTDNTTITVLPEEMRPKRTIIINLACEPIGDNSIANISINKNGEVKILKFVGGNWLSFDGVSFSTK